MISDYPFERTLIVIPAKREVFGEANAGIHSADRIDFHLRGINGTVGSSL